jgi:hypothetical protein
LRNKFWVLVITRDPPANTQCISFNSEFQGGVPKTRFLFRLANVPVLFVSGLISDKLYSKLKRLLGVWVGGVEVIALMMFKASQRLVIENGSFNMVG